MANSYFERSTLVSSRVIKQTIFLLLILLGLSWTDQHRKALPDNFYGKVIGVSDGDTIDLLFNGKPLRIRLEHIDCPELRRQQPFGQAAKQFTSDQCFGKNVQIKHRNKFDRNKRLIGVVILPGGANLNGELVKAGLAWHFKKYSTDKSYDQLEKVARAKRIGLWSDSNPTPPWMWRISKHK